jgi:[1-hydroxy-2-(trimethylamino)ethyl]phosphonate dioxygenase
MPSIDALFEILRCLGERQYGREAVSQLEHALQCATLAERDVAGPKQVTAALLHDIGHLVDDLGAPASDAEADADMRHEERAARYLARWFDSEVTEPVRLHVPAKRFLVATDPAYRETLSPASVHSLELQGGAMSAEEAGAFARKPYAAEAVVLRRWDDLAKVPGAVTPPLEHFRPTVEACGVARQ